MPTLDTRGQTPVKMLLVGDPGTGKTGSIASLAAAGYEPVILDLENGLDPLVGFTPPAALSRIHYATVTEEYKFVAGRGVRVIPRGDASAPPSAFPEIVRLLTHWRLPGQNGAPDEDLGPPESWDSSRRILVLDSLTALGEMIMAHVLALNGRLSSGPDQSDWGTAQRIQDAFISKLCSTSLPCSLIVTAHLRYVRERTDQVMDNQGRLKTVSRLSDKLYPTALGAQLPKNIARHFNTMVLCAPNINGARSLHLIPNDEVEVKVPREIPNTQRILPIATGLATLFRHLHGTPPQETART